MKILSARYSSFTVQEVCESIFKAIPRENIEHIYVFGSTIKPKFKIIEETEWYGFLLMRKKKVKKKVMEEPNDIDIFVLAKKSAFDLERNFYWDAKGRQAWCGSYGSGGYTNIKGDNILHLHVTTQSEFANCLKSNYRDAGEINRHKVCIY